MRYRIDFVGERKSLAVNSRSGLLEMAEDAASECNR